MIYPITAQDEHNFWVGLRNALAISAPIDAFIAWVLWRLL